MNPTGLNGTVLTCIACRSDHHLLNDRPDSWENISKTNYTETDDRYTIENDPEPDLLVLCSSLVIMKTTYHYELKKRYKLCCA